MSDSAELKNLDMADFKLVDYDNIRIEMPEPPSITEEDIDAQLFEYVISGGKQIQSIADLDDAWVRDNFDGLETVQDVRQSIKDQYDKEMEYQLNDVKLQNCCEALIARLEGEVPEDIIQNNIDFMRENNQRLLDGMHMSFEQFLREEHMTADQYEAKLCDEAIYQLKLNVALDLMADVLGTQVGNHELTEYLSAPDPEAFLAEIREKDQVENARRAPFASRS